MTALLCFCALNFLSHGLSESTLVSLWENVGVVAGEVFCELEREDDCERAGERVDGDNAGNPDLTDEFEIIASVALVG